MPIRRPHVFYGWVVVATAFICLAIAYAIWNSFSVFFVAMSTEFGWTRADTALAFSVFTIVYGLFSPISGSLVDRLGPRVIVPVGGVVLAAGLFACSFLQHAWQLYLFYGVISAIGVNLVGTMVNFTVLTNWFSRRRGMAIGIAAAGIGVGTMVLVPGSQAIIQTAGWRTAYVALAVIVLIVVPGVALTLYRTRPEDMGLTVDGFISSAGDSPKPLPPQVVVVNQNWARREWDVRAAIATASFWFLFFGMFFGTVSHQSIIVHQVAYLTDRGFDPMIGASLVGLIGIAGSVGKILWGSISDRIGREAAYTSGMLCVLIGIVILWLIQDASQYMQAYVYAIVFGIGYGVNAPLCSATAADLFQGKHFGAVYGALYVGSGAGSSLGPWLSGWLFDNSGGYQLSLIMSVGAVALSIAMYWLAAPRKVRLVPGMAKRHKPR